MSPFLYFPIFVVFLLCQYAIFVTSTYVTGLTGATGQTYWCICIVVFLILNEFVFSNFSYEYTTEEIEEDDWGKND